MEWRRFVTYLWNDPRTTAITAAAAVTMLSLQWGVSV